MDNKEHTPDEYRELQQARALHQQAQAEMLAILTEQDQTPYPLTYLPTVRYRLSTSKMWAGDVTSTIEAMQAEVPFPKLERFARIRERRAEEQQRNRSHAAFKAKLTNVQANPK